MDEWPPPQRNESAARTVALLKANPSRVCPLSQGNSARLRHSATLRRGADRMQSLEARLSRLTHAQLLRLAALGCNESTQVMAEASRMLVPLWAAEEIFLSTDLLDCIMASLALDDAAVAKVR